LLAHGRWFSPGIPASSTTKTGRHDIAEILLKVALNTKAINQSINQSIVCDMRRGFFRTPTPRHVSQGEQVRIVILIGLNSIILNNFWEKIIISKQNVKRSFRISIFNCSYI
jgi:hypothetical protein